MEESKVEETDNLNSSKELSLKKNRRSFFNTVRAPKQTTNFMVETRTVQNPLFLKKQVSTNNLLENYTSNTRLTTSSSDNILLKKKSNDNLFKSEEENLIMTENPLIKMKDSKSMSMGTMHRRKTSLSITIDNKNVTENPLFNKRKVEEILNKHITSKIDKANVMKELSSSPEINQRINPLFNNKSRDLLSKHLTLRSDRGNIIDGKSKKKTTKKKNSKNKKKLDPFNTSLQDIMTYQNSAHPTIKIPYIMKFLAEKVIELGGNKTTGIFRISISNEYKDKVIEQLRNEDYSLDTKDPHVPAVLLKHFLRSLKEPLVPFYEQAINLSESSLDLEENFKQKFNKIKMLWELCKSETREVIMFLSNFIEDLTKSEYVEITKMDTTNLVTIFAPVFLSNPSNIPENLLSSQPKEERFTHLILKFAALEISQSSTEVSLLNGSSPQITKEMLNLDISQIKKISAIDHLKSSGDTPRLKRLK